MTGRTTALVTTRPSNDLVMNIQPPPVSVAQLHYFEIYDYILQFAFFFRDEDFENRYFSQFKWFREELPQTERVLNLGCGNGRETFALMWVLGATEAVGIDIEDTKIESAKHIVRLIHEFSAQVMPPILSGQMRRVEQLQAWYEDNIRFEIRQCTLPLFYQGDITISISQPSDYFDLVYCRYLLDKLADKSKDRLRVAIKNIARAVSPKRGRVIIVEPTVKDDFQYDFEACFVEAGLSLVKVQEGGHLGFLEWPETDPRGYILTKRVVSA
jgi:SAM-dependent methyltransferase